MSVCCRVRMQRNRDQFTSSRPRPYEAKSELGNSNKGSVEGRPPLGKYIFWPRTLLKVKKSSLNFKTTKIQSLNYLNRILFVPINV
uniref:Uncharacterized protein n=2 Tax=Aegilops tauschii subsp. strangulata TaxID=200361 RepID=A0A453SPS6_AEGTS